MLASGRFWAYVGIVLGGVVSLAANYAHTYVPPLDASAGWAPRPGAVVAALCWPILLFVAVEILVRTAWPRRYRWHTLLYLGLLPVAVVAAFVSYRHLSGLLAYYGEDHLTSMIGPLAIDGLMVIATGALLATARHSEAHEGCGNFQEASARPPRGGKTVAGARKEATNDELTAVTREIAAELDAKGIRISRRNVSNRLRERGHAVATDRARVLLRSLRED